LRLIGFALLLLTAARRSFLAILLLPRFAAVTDHHQKHFNQPLLPLDFQLTSPQTISTTFWLPLHWTPSRLLSASIMASNITVLDLPPLPSYSLKPLPSLIPGISDTVLSLIAPIFAYWVISAFFHIIDVYDLMPQYRLHTPAELLKRNHATQWDVFRDVVIQQIIQTIFGISVSYFDPEPTFGKENYNLTVWARRIRVAQRVIPWVLGFTGLDSSELGQKLGGPTSMLAGALAGGKYPHLQQLVELNGETVLAPAFASWELQVAKFIYWAAIPTLQFLLAIFIMDSWQYFLHRGMHMNQWLYSKS